MHEFFYLRIHEIGENQYMFEVMYMEELSASSAASNDMAFGNVEAVADFSDAKVKKKIL